MWPNKTHFLGGQKVKPKKTSSSQGLRAMEPILEFSVCVSYLSSQVFLKMANHFKSN